MAFFSPKKTNLWLLWFAKSDIISTLKVNPGVTLIEKRSDGALFWTLEQNLDIFHNFKINLQLKRRKKI